MKSKNNDNDFVQNIDFKQNREISYLSQRSFNKENNLYQEFNEKNLLAFKISSLVFRFKTRVLKT